MILNGANVSTDDVKRYFAPADVNGNLLNPEGIAEKIAEWSVYFFGDKEQEGHYHIRGEVPKFHKEIYKDLACDFKLYYISAPSEFSKTTIATLIYPLYRTAYYNEPYIVISSRVDDTAMELLDEIKNELRYNDKFKDVYGALLPLPEEKTKSRYKKKDSAHLIELENGTIILCVSWGGNVRTRKRKGYRITLFIGDDPEEVADCKSEAIIEANKVWLKRSVVPRIDKELGKVRIVGTRIGMRCTIANLMKDPNWKGRVYKAMVDDPNDPGKESVLPIEKRFSIWEKRWSTKSLLVERRNKMIVGELDDWMYERQNEPMPSLLKNLRGYKYFAGEFERHHEQNLLHLEGYLDPIPIYNYHSIDPAFAQAESSDERAQVTFAKGLLPIRLQTTGEMDYMTAIWVLEYDFDHKDPDTIIERALELHRKYYYHRLIVETIGGQKLYEFTAVKTMQKDPFLLKYPLDFDFIDYHERAKQDRIYSYFKPVLKLGQVFIRPGMDKLQDEFDYFLQCSHLHLLDALEFGCRRTEECRESVYKMNPKSRFYKQYYADPLEEELAEQGKEWMLW